MKQLTPEQALSRRCPTCGAAPGAGCDLGNGQPRTELHCDRQLIAAEKLGL
jgi:hypothetical protein